MKKQEKGPLVELLLTENNSIVSVRLIINEKIVLDYNNEEARAVRVISPLPDKEALLNNLQYFTERDPVNNTIEKQIKFYVTCREREIFDQVHVIRKAAKKIGRQVQCISMVKKLVARDSRGSGKEK